jgi:hypothetical protein
MKRAGFYLVTFAILAHVVVWAQQPSNGSSDTLAFENGSIADNMYRMTVSAFLSRYLPVGS